MKPNMDHSLHEKESCNLPCITLKSQKIFYNDDILSFMFSKSCFSEFNNVDEYFGLSTAPM